MIHSSSTLLGRRSRLIDGHGEVQDRQVHDVQQAGDRQHGEAEPLAPAGLPRRWVGGHPGSSDVPAVTASARSRVTVRGTPRALPAATLERPSARARRRDPRLSTRRVQHDPPVDEGPRRRRRDRRPGTCRPRTGSSSRRPSARWASGSTPGPASMDEQVRVPVREEADRRGRVLVRGGTSGEVDQLAAPLVPVRHEGEIRRSPLRVDHADPGPVGDVLPRRRPESPEVRADEVLQPLLLGRVVRADPVLREGEPVGAPALPRARRRDADEVHPVAQRPDEALRDVAELLDRLRAVARASRSRSAVSRRRCSGGSGLHALRPLLARTPDAGGEQPELPARDEVDRRPHQRRLDHRPVLQRRASGRRARSRATRVHSPT